MKGVLQEEDGDYDCLWDMVNHTNSTLAIPEEFI